MEVKKYKGSKKNTERRFITRFVLKVLFLVFFIWYVGCIPDQLFSHPTSTVILDKKGELLGAQIAADGQWRFPPSDSVPEKLKTCLIAFEDRNFYNHFGVSMKGIARAIKQNVSNKKRVSGGSTITMQTIRMSRHNPRRTYFEKCIEICMATRLEFSYSKQEILAMYLSNAPFGNNVVGAEAAAWRYFGRAANELSWAESATLAVLPNAPSLMYPGKNETELKNKRDRLLNYLYKSGEINGETYELSLAEPLPSKPKPLPGIASHLMQYVIKKGKKGQLTHTTIDYNLQEKMTSLMQMYQELWKDNQIHNAAILISSVKTGEVICYIGNTHSDDEENSSAVDCIQAKRSSGSILKPLLYEKALERGLITPHALIYDVPVQFGNFTPKNFSGTYEGALPVNVALARSLNVPMVQLLEEYGVTKFHSDLRTLGITSINKPSRHYGLSLILGGAEVTLYEMNQLYLHFAQSAATGMISPLHVEKQADSEMQTALSNMNRAAVYETLEALIEVRRPDEDNQWKLFASSQKIAWKTGTSFGFRDAWSIGISPDYVVSVWVGNADGEGRPGLTGVKAAAPLMFDIFRQLNKSERWFPKPTHLFEPQEICVESGRIAGKYCPNKKWEMLPKCVSDSKRCSFHQEVNLSADGKFRVNASCEDIYKMKKSVFFVFPPLVEKYYKITHPNHQILPPFKSGCNPETTSMHILYPLPNSNILIPKQMNEDRGEIIAELVHQHANKRILWHLDQQFLGETTGIHQLKFTAGKGKHIVKAIDEDGVACSVVFYVDKERK
jgi:penicillin-binding protein 1C